MTSPSVQPPPSVQPQTTKLTPLVLVAVIITVLAWASAFIVIRGTGEFFGGGALALARLLVGTALLGIVVIVRRSWLAPTPREWLLLVGYGVLWFGVYNVALNLAEQSVDAGTASMIVNIGPILIALGAATILREGITRWLALGAGVAFLGVILIGIGTSGGTAAAGAPVVGLLLALAAAVTYAAGVLMQKPVLRRLPGAQVTWLGCAIGMVACLPFAGELVSDLGTAPFSAIAGAVYLGVVPTAIAFSTWSYALARVPAGQLGVSTYVVPPLVIVFGLLVFQEVPVPLAIVGGVLCLAGVAVSRYRPRTTANV